MANDGWTLRCSLAALGSTEVSYLCGVTDFYQGFQHVDRQGLSLMLFHILPSRHLLVGSSMEPHPGGHGSLGNGKDGTLEPALLLTAIGRVILGRGTGLPSNH